MKNMIQKELELAQSKLFEEIIYNDKKLVKLTRDNVAIAEAMIQNDSAYIHSLDVSAALVYGRGDKVKYGGSSAFWMTELKNVLFKLKKSRYAYEKIIKGAVEAVDRENSTHLNADKCGRDEIIK